MEMEEELGYSQQECWLVRALGKPTLSPHIVRLAHVRIVNAASLVYLQTAVALIVRQNLVSGNHESGFGI